MVSNFMSKEMICDEVQGVNGRRVGTMYEEHELPFTVVMNVKR